MYGVVSLDMLSQWFTKYNSLNYFEMFGSNKYCSFEN
jgi:hypothetical protein